MALWFVFSLMTALAVFAILLPLGRRGTAARGGTETAVYADQYAEVTRDAASGLIGPGEAEAARIEISRRMIAASDRDNEAAAHICIAGRRTVALVALILLPALATILYIRIGAPQIGDYPLASRAVVPVASQPLEDLVRQVEAQLAANPTDARGWSVLAPVLIRLGRLDDAVTAYRNVIAFAGDNAARRADLGEALVAAANGLVTADAKSEFERAAALDARESKARYFLGLAAEQDGARDDAAKIWRAMLDDASADAPWRPFVRAALTRVGGVGAPVLSDSDVAAAKDMTEADRSGMVRGMVERLASRLKENGDDLDGWLRLMRAYMVLGDNTQARGALNDARRNFAADPDRLKQIDEAAKGLGLDAS